MLDFLIPVTVNSLPTISSLNGKQGLFILPDGSLHINRKDGTWYTIRSSESSSSFIGAVTTSSTFPAEGDLWGTASEGTYANAGDLTIGARKLGILSRVAGNWSKVEVAMPAVPLQQTIGLSTTDAMSQKAVTEELMFIQDAGEIVAGKNIANPEDLVLNYYFSSASGNIIVSYAGRHGWWVEVEEGKTYFVQGRNRTEVAFFAEKNLSATAISYVNAGTLQGVFTVPSGANWAFCNVVFGDVTPYLTTFMVSENNSLQVYEPYTKTLLISKDKVVTENSLLLNNYPISGITVAEIVVGKNKIDKSKIISTHYFSPGNNAMTSVEGTWRGVWVENDFEVGKSYIVSGRNRPEVAFFSANRVTPLSYVQSGSFVVPIGTEAIFINITNSNTDTYNDTVMMREASEDDVYEAYSAKVMLKKELTQLTDSASEEDIVKELIPKKVYVVGGSQLNLYKWGLVKETFGSETPFIDMICTIGSTYSDKFQYDVEVSANSNIGITSNVYKDDALKSSNSIVIERKPSTNGSGGTRKVLIIGASKSTHIPSKLNDLFSTDVMNLDFVGTKLDNGIKHEAISGKTLAYFNSAGGSAYKFYFTGLMTNVPNLEDVLTHNGNTFNVTEVNINSATGDGHITTNMTAGTNAIASSGTLVNTTQSNSINYDSTSVDGGNIFWNSSTNKFDLGKYLTDTSQTMADGDWVIIELGTNDLFSTSGGNYSSALATAKINLQAIVNEIHSYNPNIRIGISTIAGFGNQDAFGVTYKAKYSRAKWINNVWFPFNRWILDTYDNEVSSNIFVVNQHCTIDVENSIKTLAKPIDEFNTSTETIQQDPLHLTENGYKQMARTIYNVIKCKA